MINRRNRRAGKTVSPETLEQRTLLTTAGSTITQVLYAQADDSGVIDFLVERDRLGENAGANLQVKLDAYLDAAGSGKTGLAAKKFATYAAQVEKLRLAGKVSDADAERLIDLSTFDRNPQDYDILRQVAIRTGGTDLLNKFHGAFTVFAPTDRAFRNLADNLGGNGATEADAYESIVSMAASMGGGNPVPVLNSILEYHIVRGQRDKQWLRKTDYQVGDTVEFNNKRFAASVDHTSGQKFIGSKWDRIDGRSNAAQNSLSFQDLIRTVEIETFGGETFELEQHKRRGDVKGGWFVVDADRDLPNARINKAQADIPAKNGVIHQVTEVLIPIDLIVPPTILETVDGGAFDTDGSDFDILTNAIMAVDDANDDPDAELLADLLDNPDAEVTVFAPTDQAFIDLANELGYAGSDEAGAFMAIVDAAEVLGSGNAIPVIDSVLRYHLSAGEQSVSDIAKSRKVITDLGPTITAKGRVLRDQDPDIADPVMVKGRSDIRAENGVIHVLDGVLLPIDLDTADTLADRLAASGGEFDGNSSDFDILFNAVDAAGLTDDLADPNSTLTVFAPTDNAFIVFAQSLGFEGIDEEGAFNTIVDTLTDLGGGNPIPLLTDVLLYHVASGQQSVSKITKAGSVKTLNGASFTVQNRLIDKNDDFDNGTINQNRSNVKLENGIFHVISRVLLPIDL